MAAKQIPKDIVDDFVARHPEFDFVSLQLGEGFLDSPVWTATADKLQTLDAVISVDSARCNIPSVRFSLSILRSSSWFPHGINGDKGIALIVDDDGWNAVPPCEKDVLVSGEAVAPELVLNLEEVGATTEADEQIGTAFAHGAEVDDTGADRAQCRNDGGLVGVGASASHGRNPSARITPAMSC